MKYYTPLIILVWMTLLALCIVVKENERLSKDKKFFLYSSYIIAAIAALSEWLGVQLSGNMDISPWVLRIVKLFDYVLTPLVGGVIAFQFETKNLFKKIMFSFIAANTLYQIIAFFTGWMVLIDAYNHYYHGPGYFIYTVFYMVIMVFAIFEFVVYGKNFRKQNHLSLIVTMAIFVTGILMQEILGKEVRMAYISLVTCFSLLYIHNSEFAMLESDDKIREQMIRISVDPLTGISNRYAYTMALLELSDLKSLPEDLVVFSIDINGLKTTNDLLGHHAGDELIKGAADCINSVFSQYGKCFRIGGDEFVVFANVSDEDTINNLKVSLEQETEKWRGEEVHLLSLSVGKARVIEHPEVMLEKLVNMADREMYKAKAEYYKEVGIDRRKS